MRAFEIVDPMTGLDRWRIERAGTSGRSQARYGLGWFATNLRTGVGAYQPTHSDALAFADAQVRAQAERMGWSEDAVRDYQERRRLASRARKHARALRYLAHRIDASRPSWAQSA